MAHHWLQSFVPSAAIPSTSGAYGEPVDLGDVQVAVREGNRVHVHEIAPGLVLVATIPDVPTVGATPGVWAGVATAASGVVTSLGDWVAGFFPKAQEAKAKGAAASSLALNDVVVDNARTADQLARIQERAERRQREDEYAAQAAQLQMMQQQAMQAQPSSSTDELMTAILALMLAVDPIVSGRRRQAPTGGPYRVGVTLQPLPPRVGCDCGGTCGSC